MFFSLFLLSSTCFFFSLPFLRPLKVGKTSLVDELHKRRQRGLFARGKFDIFKRDSSCLLSAFRTLILQLLVTDALQWKVRLLRALGSNGQVMIDVIPELVRLIGEQPPVPKLSTSETAGRFQMVFCQFVSALASPSSPLTLFLDDVQCADSGSLALLTLLVTQESAYLLVIAAYRMNEVSEDDLLMRSISEIRRQHSERVTNVVLKPLEVHHISQLLSDSFRKTEQEVLPLTQLLFSKTQGNAYFIATMLRTFHEAGWLTFNFQEASWVWELECMSLVEVAEDVVQLLCHQMLTGLSKDSQQFLQFAACCGNSFNLYSLGVITSQMKTFQTLIRSVCELVRAGMLICTSRHQDLVLLEQEIQQQPASTSTSAAVASDGTSAVCSDPGMVIGISPIGTTRRLATPTTTSAVFNASNDALQLFAGPESYANILRSITLSFSHDKIQAAASERHKDRWKECTSTRDVM